MDQVQHSIVRFIEFAQAHRPVFNQRLDYHQIINRIQKRCRLELAQMRHNGAERWQKNGVFGARQTSAVTLKNRLLAFSAIVMGANRAHKRTHAERKVLLHVTSYTPAFITRTHLG